MEPKFKIGDRVKVKACGSVADGMTGTVLESDPMPYIRFDVKSDDLHDCNGLCEDGYGYAINQSELTKIRCKKQKTTETTGITISVSELKRIHDVACGEWKLKIKSMVTPFQDEVFVSNEQIDEMLKAATTRQMPIVEDVFKEYVKKQKPEFFNFGSEYTLDLTSNRKPIYIRHGLANYGYDGREIGFSSDYTTILVDTDGNETELTSGHYLKFKIKK